MKYDVDGAVVMKSYLHGTPRIDMALNRDFVFVEDEGEKGKEKEKEKGSGLMGLLVSLSSIIFRFQCHFCLI